MAKVPLRAYNHEIEALIERGHLDEAIAHCRHILQNFPKHLETYRMLGKACLEAKRYDEAVDVFSRVLMAVPDDFVSHVGMSIIRDDQNRLDDAIWHMERAFEAQPSNAAIQAELQRLFGRRDGTQPPKIRMTRGALAHMYMQGELYPQAISEIKAVLSQDNQRDDMKALLARAYFHSGQKADASDICSQLLKRYPYSFDANRIMLELLHGSETPDNVQIYRSRVNELDPYAAFTDGTVFRSNEVADAAVSLERMEYKGEEAQPATPDWSAPGIGVAATAVTQEAEWLNAGLRTPEPEQPVLAAPVKPESEIPDFLRAAGWKETSGATEEPSVLEAESEIAGEAELTPGDMPDWLKAIAPKDQEAVAGPSTPDMPDWLSDLRSEAPVSTSEGDIPGWLRSLDEEQTEEVHSAQEAELPDWLKSAAESTPIEPEMPVEPTQLGSEVSSSAAVFEPEQIPGEPEVSPETAFMESGVFLEPLVTEPSQVKLEGLDELTSIEPEAFTELVPPEEKVPSETVFVEPQTPREAVPEHLTSPLSTAETPAKGEPAGIQEGSIEEVVPLAAEIPEASGFGEPESPAEVAPVSVIEPEMPGGFSSIEPEVPAVAAGIALETLSEESIPEVPNVQAVTPPPSLERLGMSAQEQDDAMAWLESLAAKHGAKSEELVTDPNARTDKPPAWVEQARALSQPPAEATEAEEPSPVEPPIPAEATPVIEMPSTEMEPAIEAPISLEQPVPETPAATEKDVSEAAISAETPGIEAAFTTEEAAAGVYIPPEEPTAEIPAVREETEAPGTSADETGIWLRELTGKEQAAEVPTEEKQFASESVESGFTEARTDMPAWLNKIDSEARAADETQPIAPIKPQEAEAETPELPDWLRGLDEEQKWAAPASIGDELPSWLQGEPEPLTQAEPTAPTDWRHVETSTEPQEVSAEPEVKPAPEVETGQGVQPPQEMRAVPIPGPEARAISESEPVIHRQPAPPASKRPPVRLAAERRPGGMVAPVSDAELAAAQSEMKRGDIPAGLEHYSRLIKKGRSLEEVIRDLREALYRYPVEVTIWQTLGDAYMRENRLQEALDAYTKAEELLR